MFLNRLYTIEQFKSEAQTVEALVKLNPSHEIFKGHFPSQPVLPGVCLIEMLGDLLGQALNATYTLSSASNIKYLKVVDPLQNQLLRFEMKFTQEDDAVALTATSLLEDGSANFKFKGTFIS